MEIPSWLVLRTKRRLSRGPRAVSVAPRLKPLPGWGHTSSFTTAARQRRRTHLWPTFARQVDLRRCLSNQRNVASQIRDLVVDPHDETSIPPAHLRRRIREVIHYDPTISVAAWAFLSQFGLFRLVSHLSPFSCLGVIAKRLASYRTVLLRLGFCARAQRNEQDMLVS